jgi:hypothetical protein
MSGCNQNWNVSTDRFIKSSQYKFNKKIKRIWICYIRRTDGRGACTRCILVTLPLTSRQKGLRCLCIQSPQNACLWGSNPWSLFPTFLNSITAKLFLIWYSVIKWSARNNNNVPLFLANFWIHRGHFPAISVTHLLALIVGCWLHSLNWGSDWLIAFHILLQQRQDNSRVSWPLPSCKSLQWKRAISHVTVQYAYICVTHVHTICDVSVCFSFK